MSRIPQLFDPHYEDFELEAACEPEVLLNALRRTDRLQFESLERKNSAARIRVGLQRLGLFGLIALGVEPKLVADLESCNEHQTKIAGSIQVPWVTLWLMRLWLAAAWAIFPLGFSYAAFKEPEQITGLYMMGALSLTVLGVIALTAMGILIWRIGLWTGSFRVSELRQRLHELAREAEGAGAERSE